MKKLFTVTIMMLALTCAMAVPALAELIRFDFAGKVSYEYFYDGVNLEGEVMTGYFVFESDTTGVITAGNACDTDWYDTEQAFYQGAVIEMHVSVAGYTWSGYGGSIYVEDNYSSNSDWPYDRYYVGVGDLEYGDYEYGGVVDEFSQLLLALKQYSSCKYPTTPPPVAITSVDLPLVPPEISDFRSARLWMTAVNDDDLIVYLDFFTLGEIPISDTVIIGDCDTGVEDAGGMQASIDEIIADCECAKNNGQYVSCVAKALNVLKKEEGTITGKQKGAMMKCVATQGDPCP